MRRLTEWENTNAPSALSESPRGSSEHATSVALSPCGFFVFSEGFATCPASRHHMGLHFHPAAWYAMRVTLVPTRAVTAPVRRLAHLCFMIAWFLTRCAQPGREGDGAHARAAVVNAEEGDEPALPERTPRASTTVSKEKRHTHLTTVR